MIPTTPTTLLSTAYLPPITWIVAVCQADKVLVEQWEHYQKQSYRNRCHIAAANGIMPMSIPVEHNKKEKVLTRDVRISEHSDWQRQHWRSLESAYRTSPFFEYYADDYAPFYHQKYEFLLDFNQQILDKTLELLNINKEFHLTDDYTSEYAVPVCDLRETIHPKRKDDFQAKRYYQVFEEKHGFLANLSVIDLLFNMGNEAQLIIQHHTNNKKKH